MVKSKMVSVPTSKIPTVISWYGVLFFLLYVIDILIFTDMSEGAILQGGVVVDSLLSLSYSIGIVCVATRLGKSSLSNERYKRIGKWFVGGMILFVAIDFPQLLVWSPATIESFAGGTRRALALGGLCGLIFGIIEARAIEREKVAEREAVRAEEAETQRQELNYLNALLRHEILNTVHVIHSYSTKVLEENQMEMESQSDIETIQRRAEGMSEVIEDMQVLIRATQEADNRKAINLKEIAVIELDELRDINPDVKINASIPEDIYVKADEVLNRVFANLFTNAVEHNDSEIPRVDVTAEVDGERVRVSIADNGPGIPERELDTLLEASDTPSSTHGLGLYLVRTLVERYGGQVYVSETGTDGSTFTVELTRATDVSTGGVPPSAATSSQVLL